MKFVRRPAAFFSLFLILLLGPLPAAEPASTDDLIKSLQEAVTQYVKKAKEKSDGSDTAKILQNPGYTERWFQSIRQAAARGDINSLQQALREIQSYFPDEAVQKSCTELLAKIQDDTVAKEKTYVESVDSLVSKSVTTAFAAKSAKELDDFIIELSRLSQRPEEYTTSEFTRRTSTKARAAVDFLCRWQDYLAQTQSGNIAAAQNVLREISQNTASYPFIPRSEILERMGGEKNKVENSRLPNLEGKTLKDLKDLSTQVEESLIRNPNQNELRQFAENLNALRRALSDFENGVLGKALSYCINQSESRSADLAPFRQELLIKVLPAYLNAGKSYPPKEGENASEYLLRIIADAKGKGDWNMVWKTLETYRTVAFTNGQSPTWISSDVQGCASFISGQNYEKAGQFIDAIRAYKRVLAQPGENLPLAEATTRLSALQKEHPEDYETATKTVEASRAIYPPTTPTALPR